MSSFDESDAFEGASLAARAMNAMAARSNNYLDGLNPAQREGVEALDGPVLMLAGAGTGKTKALMTRVAHLIRTGRARSDQILAVTFTNKAAKEMRTRLEKEPFGIETPMRWMGTFHAICVKILRKHAELVGAEPSQTRIRSSALHIRDEDSEESELGPYDLGAVPRPQSPPREPAVSAPSDSALHLHSNFTILDTDDQKRVLKQLIQASGMDDKRWTASALASLIDRWKNSALLPDKVPASEASAFDGKGIELYRQYQRRLIELNAVDFGDLLLHMVTIFQTHDDILQQYQRWFRYILVDEYQDTNVAQYLWLRLLAGGHKNICCVGDDDQSIYGWRGAEVGNILRFEKDFPGATVVRLEQNYRSTPHILAAAGGVIAGNKGRLGKELWTEAQEGEKVRLIGHWDGEEEARWIGEEVESMQGGTRGMRPMGLDDMAILVRASHQMRAFEDRFLTIGLPYRVIGGPRFYERMEIRDAMAYFRLVVSPSDDLAFERIVNTPKRGLGEKAQQKIQLTARTHGLSLLEGSAALLDEKGLGGKGGTELLTLVRQTTLWRWLVTEQGNKQEIAHLAKQEEKLDAEASALADEIAILENICDLENLDEVGEEALNRLEGLREQHSVLKSQIGIVQTYQKILLGDHVRLAELILEDAGYIAMWQNDKTPEAPGRLENLKELVKALEQFENLQGFLEHVSLIMDNESEEAGEKVSIMTLHAAKGLEFPAVFLPGWEDGLFPSQRSMDESGVKGLEEERRLAYVGITRAEEVCTISFAGNRRVYGQWQSQMPSRFIDELPEAHVEVLTPPGLYGGGYGAAGMDSFGGGGIEARAAAADGYNSPGWKRLQARSGQRPMSQPKESKSQVIDAQAISSHTVGERVFHQKFGYGTITGIEGDKLDIAFEKAGDKKVVSRFVTGADDIPF